MIINGVIRDWKLRKYINREILSAWLSSKADKCEYLTGQDILPFNQNQMTEQPSLDILLKENYSKTT